MSDFTSNFWSVFVAGVTVISIIACLILLVITARKKVASTADNTTGHVWDEDLTEMNNPMPRWWMWLFVITIVFGFLYLAMYPGWASSPDSWVGPRSVSTSAKWTKAMPRLSLSMHALPR